MARRSTPKTRIRKTARMQPFEAKPELINAVREDLRRVDRALFGDTPALSGQALEDSIRSSIHEIFGLQ